MDLRTVSSCILSCIYGLCRRVFCRVSKVCGVVNSVVYLKYVSCKRLCRVFNVCIEYARSLLQVVPKNGGIYKVC